MADTHADFTELQPLLSMLGQKIANERYELKQEKDDETLDPSNFTL
jgi:hypothetical protein